MLFLHKTVWYVLTIITLIIEVFIKLIWLPFAVVILFFAILFGLNYVDYPIIVKTFEYGTKFFDSKAYYIANTVSDFYYPYK